MSENSEPEDDSTPDPHPPAPGEGWIILQCGLAVALAFLGAGGAIGLALWGLSTLK